MISALSAALSTHVGLRRIFGEISYTECTGQGNQGNDFELISMVEMETRNPIEHYFGSEFPTICNRYRVIAAWSRKTLKFLQRNFFIFLEKQPLTVKFSKFCSKRFHRLTDRRVVCKFCEIWLTGNQWNRVLLTWQNKIKFCHALHLSLQHRSCPKSARASPQEYTQSAPKFRPNPFTFSGVLAKCVNTAKTRHKVNPILGWSLAWSQIKGR